jgi:hypothetical protein
MYKLIYEASIITGSYYHNIVNPYSIDPVKALKSLQYELVHSEQVTQVRELLMGVESMLLELVS